MSATASKYHYMYIISGYSNPVNCAPGTEVSAAVARVLYVLYVGYKVYSTSYLLQLFYLNLIVIFSVYLLRDMSRGEVPSRGT